MIKNIRFGMGNSWLHNHSRGIMNFLIAKAFHAMNLPFPVPVTAVSGRELENGKP